MSYWVFFWTPNAHAHTHAMDNLWLIHAPILLCLHFESMSQVLLSSLVFYWKQQELQQKLVQSERSQAVRANADGFRFVGTNFGCLIPIINLIVESIHSGGAVHAFFIHGTVSISSSKSCMLG